jgi:HK97 family phage portal protein
VKNPFKGILKSRSEREFDNRVKTILRDDGGNVIGVVNADRYFGIFSSAVCDSNLVTLFNEISEIQFPIRAIAERAINAKFYLKDFSTDSVIWNNEEINKFLTGTNEMESFDQFFAKLITYYLLLGDTYIYSHIPATLRSSERWKICDNYYILPSDKIEIKIPAKPNLYAGAKISDIISGYMLYDGTREIIFPPENVLHLRDINMYFNADMMYGRSRMEALKYPISNLIAVYESRNVIYTKRGALGFIVSKKKDESGSVPLTKKERDNMLDSYHGTYGVDSKRNPIAFSDVDVDYVNVGISIKDMEPFRETLADAIQIAGAFGVPADLVPREDNSTFENKKQAEISLYENVVIPLTNRIIKELNTWFGFREEKGGAYLQADFSDIPCLQQDRLKEAELKRITSDTAIKEFNAGVVTFNEMRVACGYEKVEGGDYFKTPEIVQQDEDGDRSKIIQLKPIKAS